MRHHSTINGRMSRLINFLGNFIIVVLFHAASSLSPPTNSFEMLFFFSLSSIILDKRTLPYFVSKLSIFWFPPKGIKGIRVVFELFQFQSLHQRCIQFNRDRSCFVTKGGGKKKKQKTCLPQTTMVKISFAEVKKRWKFSNLFQSCWTRDTIDGKAIWRSVGSGERSARGKKMNARRPGYSFRLVSPLPYILRCHRESSFFRCQIFTFSRGNALHSGSQRGVDLWKDWIKSSATKDRQAARIADGIN